jgi:hypothetical protein
MNGNLMVIALEMSITLYLRIGVPYLQLTFFLQHTSLQLINVNCDQPIFKLVLHKA